LGKFDKRTLGKTIKKDAIVEDLATNRALKLLSWRKRDIFSI
jgi:hypothetical protein